MSPKLSTSPTATDRGRTGFTLVELLSAMAVLSILLTILLTALSSISTIYVRSEQKVQSQERGRSILELFAREATPAVVDTRMQFVILPGDKIADAGAKNIAPASPAAVWMAPLGSGGDLRCVGYYLTRDDDLRRYRLKRMYIRHDNPDDYFPKLGSSVTARGMEMRTSPVNAVWFTSNWDEKAFDDVSPDNDKSVVSTVSGGVVGFWVGAIDTFGNPVPLMSEASNHPASDLMFNSAGYFYFAEVKPFDSGDTFVYLAKDKLTMKANKVPAELEVAVLMLSDDDLANASAIPEMINVYTSNGALDLTKSIEALQAKLDAMGLKKSEVFRTRVKLTNGG